MIWLLDKTWQCIRDDFSEDEKLTLRSAVRGETICPAGFHIDVDALDAGLAEKLTDLVLRHKAVQRG